MQQRREEKKLIACIKNIHYLTTWHNNILFTFIKQIKSIIISNFIWSRTYANITPI
jgi:hypothetical protein